MCLPTVCSAAGGQKGVLRPLELELWSSEAACLTLRAKNHCWEVVCTSLMPALGRQVHLLGVQDQPVYRSSSKIARATKTPCLENPKPSKASTLWLMSCWDGSGAQLLSNLSRAPQLPGLHTLQAKRAPLDAAECSLSSPGGLDPRRG